MKKNRNMRIVERLRAKAVKNCDHEFTRVRTQGEPMGGGIFTYYDLERCDKCRGKWRRIYHNEKKIV